MSNPFLYIAISIVAILATGYLVAVVAYYVTQLLEVSKVRSLIDEIQNEYNAEIKNLYLCLENGKLDVDQLCEKEEFITSLYMQMFNDLEDKFLKKYNKERIRLK